MADVLTPEDESVFFGTEPVLDSHGNLWALVLVEGELRVLRRDAASAEWSVDTTYLASGAGEQALLIDRDDRISVVFREGNQIRMLRYAPDLGWAPPETIVTVEDGFFQDISAGLDAEGNIVVLYQIELPSTFRIVGVIFDAASGTWSPPQLISGRQQRVVTVPTVVASDNGEHMFVAYLDIDTARRPGLYAREFISPSEGFGEIERVPGTARASLPQLGSFAEYSAVVDDQGALTLPFSVEIPFGDDRLFLFRAARRENGAWQAPQTLHIYIGDFPFFLEFGDADTSSDGDVAVILRHNDSFLDEVVWAFTYDQEIDTWRRDLLYVAEGESTTRARIAHGDEIGVLASYTTGGVDRRFTSRLFRNSQWLDALGVADDVFASAIHETVLADDAFALVGEFGSFFTSDVRISSSEFVPQADAPQDDDSAGEGPKHQQ
ncbi:MAG: hypothetical protein AAGA68_22720 [Pseudomonadota bacterium]